MRWTIGLACAFLVTAVPAQTLKRNWVKTWSQMGSSIDEPFRVRAASGGAVYVSGKTRIPGSVEKLVLLKYAADGALLWTRIYAGIASRDDEISNLDVTPSGRIVLSGRAGATAGTDAIVVVYRSDGSVEWEKRYPLSGFSFDVPKAVVAEDGAVVLSYTSGEDFRLAKLGPMGIEFWHRSWGGLPGGFDTASDVAVDPFGNVFQVGLSQVDPENEVEQASVTLKTAPDGTLLWVHQDNGFIGNQIGTPLVTATTRGAFVAAEPESTFGVPVVLTYPLTQNGTQSWRDRWPDGATEDASPFGIKTDGSGNVFVGSYGVMPSRMTVVKYRPDGSRAWTGGYVNGSLFGVGLAVDHWGDAVIAGRTGFSPTQLDLAAFGPDGSVRGTATYRHTVGGSTEPSDVGFDRKGRILVAATVYPAADIALIQYAAVGGPVPVTPKGR